MLTTAFDLLYSAKQEGIDILLNKDQLQLKFPKNKNIDKGLLDEIKRNREDIIDFLKNHGKIIDNQNKINKSDRKNLLRIPLSFSQERLWFIDQMEGSTQYHRPTVLRLKGIIDKDALAGAFRSIIQRHEVLRTVILAEGGEPHQYIKDKANGELTLVDYPQFRDDVHGLHEYILKLVEAPFDLTKDDMLRAALISLAGQEHVLVITMHHIASDGWSSSIFLKELTALYDAHITNTTARLQPLELQYADYSLWQRQYLQGELLERKIGYWKKKLNGVAPLQLITDYPRPIVQSTKGAIVSFNINKETSDRLVQLSREQGVTLFMTLLSAFKVLLYRYTNQEDICVGTPIAGRQQQEVEELIGFFVNSLALRSEITGDVSFSELLQQVKATTLEAYEHQEVPFEKLVEAVVKERDMSRSPLFQVMLLLENKGRAAELQLGEAIVSKEEIAHNTSKFDLVFGFSETSAGLDGAVEYATGLYKSSTIERMVLHFTQLLSAIVKEPDQKIGMLPMLNAGEKQQLMVDFNNTAADYPRTKSVVELFEEQVEETPDNTAVIFGEQHLTYRELNKKADQIAQHLRSKGVSNEMMVPICLERSLDLIVGILGILKAGGAYVPIDPGYPVERIGYMLKDTGATIAVSSNDHQKVFDNYAGIKEVICMDSRNDIFSAPTIVPPVSNINSNSLAYVMYTSGSTGTPKGVMVEHGNIVSLVKAVDYVYFTKKDVLLVTGSPSFDATTFEYWGMLLNGGQLIISADEKLMNVELLKQEIKSRKVNKVWFTSSWFNSLVDTDVALFEGIETILVGGEKLSEKHITKLRHTYPSVKIINGYGPTENTTFSLTYEIEEVGTLIPVGRPLTNRKAYVLNNQLQLVPIGVPGEICVGGAGLSRGYLNHPDLTAQKFIADPFGKEGVERIYKTGDLGRWLPDGTIEYLGRIDDQVKIRGYRIEPGEIETILLENNFVKQAVVIVRGDGNGNKRLIGYVVTGTAFDKEAVVAYLRNRLPEYMVPAAWVELDSLPLTPNGKVDKKALPEVDAKSDEYTAPRTETEERLVSIWKELLLLERIGIHDNFFRLGGHSLLAMRLGTAIRKELNVEISIKDLFMQPTVALLAAHIAEQNKGQLIPSTITVQSKPEKIPLSFSQERLWFIDQLEGSIQYHMPAVFTIRGKLNAVALENAFQTIINRHEVLRTVIQAEGGKPYQEIKEKDNWKLDNVDGSPYRQDKKGLQQLIERFIETPFDLSKDYMLRASLIALTDEEFSLVITIHHIASDGWSVSVFIKELVQLYSNFAESKPITLAPLKIQYADFAIWQRQYLQGDLLNKKLAYWKEKLQDTMPLQLPTDYPRPAAQSPSGKKIRFAVDKAISSQLQEFSQQQGATLFMTMLSAFKVLLHRYSNQEDICVGIPTAGRQQQEIEGLIGFFVNTLALRSKITGDESFSEILQQVRTTTLEAYEHQEAPFEKVVESVVKERDLSRTPLFQVMMVLQNIPEGPRLRLGDVELIEDDNEHTTAKFDITVILAETPQGLRGSVEYCTDLYTENTIRQMISHFNQLLSSIVRQPDQKVRKLSMLTQAEKYELLWEFNNTSKPYAREKSIVDLFEEQVKATPDKTAVVFEDEEMRYEELNARANQLANYLKERGVKPGSNVGLLSYRCLDMIVGIMGILKTGAAYVPLNTAYPSERIAYIVEDAAVTHIVYTNLQLLQATGLERHVCVAVKESHNSSSENPGLFMEADTRAYVMYTSGTTGKPKGISVNHRNVNKLVFESGPIAVHASDRVLQWSNYAFDGSVYDIYSSLLSGASLHLIKDDWASDVHELSKVIKDQQLTVSFLTTALFNTFADIDPTVFKGLRKVLFGGEMVSPAHVSKVIATVTPGTIVHVYGPTETTVYATYYPINEIRKDGIIPIGKPLDNTVLRVLGNNKELVPVGVPGELYIGGDGVSMGYLNQPELTVNKFLDDPYSEKPGARLYRTGDLVRWLSDGNIEYLGRIDNQVKIRGYRIELGEIETVLQESGMVKQGVVLAKETANGNKRLVGYVVPNGGFDKQAISTYLNSKLPEYMVPAIWVELQSLPLTPNGKVDKKSLPDPESTDSPENEYIAPRSEAEQVLATIWQDLLELDKVGVNDNFFELGGHSLLVTQMLDRVRKLGYEIKAKDLFAYQTIEQQSKFMSTSLMLINASREGKFVIPIHSGGPNIPLFAMPDYLLFYKLINYVNSDQPFYAIEKSPHERDEDMATFYIKEIKKIHPRGPYCLVGFCRWAGIALEMAHQLKAMGEEVPVVVLIEYYPFGSRLSKTSTKYINLGVRRFYNDLNSHPTFPGKIEFLNNQLYTFRKFLFKKFKENKDPTVSKVVPPVIKPYSGKIVLISARQRPFGFKSHLDINWSERFTGEFESYIVEGDHLGIFTRRGPKQMGEKLNEIMEEVNKIYKQKTIPVNAR